MLNIQAKIKECRKDICVFTILFFVVFASSFHLSFAQSSEIERIESSIQERNTQREILEREAAR